MHGTEIVLLNQMSNTNTTDQLVLIKPEDEDTPKGKTTTATTSADDLGKNAVALEKLLKQDLDINTQEFEDLMDDFDYDELMSKPPPQPGMGFPKQVGAGMMQDMPVVAHATEEYDDDFDSDEEFINC